MSTSQPVMPLTTLTICDGRVRQEVAQPDRVAEVPPGRERPVQLQLVLVEAVRLDRLEVRVVLPHPVHERAFGDGRHVVHVVHVVGAGRRDHVAHAERVLDARLVERELLALDVVHEIHRALADLLGGPVGALGQQVAERVGTVADRSTIAIIASASPKFSSTPEVFLGEEALLEAPPSPRRCHARSRCCPGRARRVRSFALRQRDQVVDAAVVAERRQALVLGAAVDADRR